MNVMDIFLFRFDDVFQYLHEI